MPEITWTIADLDVLVVRNKIHRVAADIPESDVWQIEAATQSATRSYAPVSGDFSGYMFRVEDDKGETETIEVEVTVINAGGRTLMPGLIDSHTHFTHCLPGAGLPGMEDTP